MNEQQVIFLLIDDDPINNMISKRIIHKTLGNPLVIEFTKPEEGLDYIRNIKIDPNHGYFILLLDINMPVLNGWEVLDEFEKCDTDIKNLFTIYILSSSVDPRDSQLASDHFRVTDFIEKPLNSNTCAHLFLNTN